MPYHCPVCGAHIGHDDINPDSDRAVCRHCGTVSSFRQIEAAAEALLPPSPAAPIYDLANPPKGTWFRQLPDGFNLGASTRSWGALMFVLVIPFLSVVMARLVAELTGALPSRRNDSPFLGIVYLSLLLLISVVSFVMGVAGKVDLNVTQGKLIIFTGVGPIGWHRSYPWSDFRTVREADKQYSSKLPTATVQLGGKYGVTFGAFLEGARRQFIINALRQMLQEADHTVASSTTR